MKKIISMLTISALALGSIFADVSLEFTQKAYLYGEGGEKLQFSGYDDSKGCVKLTAKNDNAGILLDIDPKITQADKKSIALDQYTGWVNFGGGAFKFQSGVWTARSVNRFNGNSGKWKGSEYEKYKYGVPRGSIAKDINNIASINGTSYLSSALTYTTDSFYATGLLLGLDKTGKKAAGNYGTLDLCSGFGVEMGMNIGEGSKLTINLKTPANKAVAFGAFFENKTLKENLDFVIGYTFGKAANDSFETAVDLRASYALNETVTFTTMHNLSYFSYKAGATPIGAKRYDDATKTEIAVTHPQFDLWDMVSLGVKASDSILVMFTVEWEYNNLRELDNVGKDRDSSLELIPSVKYTATKGVDVSSGLIIKTTGWGEPSTAKFAIPFLLHVAL